MNNTNGKGKEGRGIGSHTDYGLLVLAAADDVGGENNKSTDNINKLKFANEM
jgi:isopenicillin N synthase-like dioxygenase